MNRAKAEAILSTDVESAIERLRAGSFARTYVMHGDRVAPLPAVIPARPGEDYGSVRSLVRYMSDATGAEAVSFLAPVVVDVGGRHVESVIAAVTWREEGRNRVSAHVFTVRRDGDGQVTGLPDFPSPPDGLGDFVSAALSDLLSPVRPSREDVAFAVDRLEKRNFMPPELSLRLKDEGVPPPTLH